MIVILSGLGIGVHAETSTVTASCLPS